MDEHYDLGLHVKDDIIPLALEYFLGVVQQPEEDDDDDDSDGDGPDNDDDDAKPKKGKKQKPAGAPGGNKGANGEDCKQ